MMSVVLTGNQLTQFFSVTFTLSLKLSRRRHVVPPLVCFISRAYLLDSLSRIVSGARRSTNSTHYKCVSKPISSDERGSGGLCAGEGGEAENESQQESERKTVFHKRRICGSTR